MLIGNLIAKTQNYYLRSSFFIASQKLNLEARRRRKGKSDIKYEKLLNLKGKYNGKRCFIVATGPSLKSGDLEQLKGEYTIAVNSICHMFSNTDWRPTFWGISDDRAYKKLKNELQQESDISIFMSQTVCDENDITDIPNNWILFPQQWAYYLYSEKTKLKFSDDAYAVVFGSETVMHCMIQLAVYLGFKDIYLLGVDCNHISGAQNHFSSFGRDGTAIDAKFVNDSMVKSFLCDFEYAKKKNINIFNATRGGKLEVFPRVNFDDIFV